MGRVIIVREWLKNYCLEPGPDCVCEKHILCGGVVEPRPDCPEHGVEAEVPDVMSTHFHEVAGFVVGTPFELRTDRYSKSG